MVKCIHCNKLKSLAEYYAHIQMKSGHLNKCKECCKELQKRRVKEGKTQEYDRKRAKTPERKKYFLQAQKARRAKFPEKDRARRLINYRLRTKQLIPKPCEVCRVLPTQAHHSDYLKPFEVNWLCQKHHTEEHYKLNKK